MKKRLKYSSEVDDMKSMNGGNSEMRNENEKAEMMKKASERAAQIREAREMVIARRIEK